LFFKYGIWGGQYFDHLFCFSTFVLKIFFWKLVVDEYAAEVVRRIYALRLTGMGYTKIAGILNTEKILSPRDHWSRCSGKYKSLIPRIWRYATLKNILRDELYLGTMTQNRTGTLSYKSKKHVRKPQSEWIRHENAFAPIIDRDIWEQVQAINRAAAGAHPHARAPEAALFKGKAVCLACGSSLRAAAIYRPQDNGEDKRFVRYSCSRYAASGRAVCSPHSVSEKTLKALLLGELKAQAQAVALDETSVLEALKRGMALDDSAQQKHWRQEAAHLEQRIAEFSRITGDLYEDKVASKISEQTFLALMEKNEQERQEKQARLDALTDKLAAVQEKILSASKWIETLRRHISIEDIGRADLEELVDRVEVGERNYSNGKRQQKIRIVWRYAGCLGAE
jgi:hypothetical protein